MNLDALVAPLRADVDRGAAAVSRAAAEVVRSVAVRATGADTEEFRRTLASLGLKMLDAQPAMAPLITLLTAVLGSLDEADGLEEARRRAAQAAEEFRGAIEHRVRRVGRAARRLLPSEGRIMTISSSSTVRAALLDGTAGDPLTVVCLEGRPLWEGRSLARALAEGGLRVTLAVDSAAEALVPDCACVLMGADSIGDRGVVNKIGSAALARAARAHGVPVWVLADETKLVPPGIPQWVADDRPSDEVWSAPGAVQIWNRYFEVIPDDLVSGIVTGRTAATPAEIHARRREMPVPPEIAVWARQHGGLEGALNPSAAYEGAAGSDSEQG